MRKFVLILLFLMFAGFFPKNTEAQMQQVMTQYLPHIVAGALPSSEWDTVIEPKCLSSAPCPMTIEFFNSIGAPLVLDTDQGMSNRFDLVISPGVPGPGSAVISIRRGQQFVSGWARVTSTSTFSGIGKFRQFTPKGVDPVGVASVYFSAPDMVLTYDLKPQNGIALVNPSTVDANVTVTALVGGTEEKRTFTLVKGGHFAAFFREPPFSFGELTGNVVISSKIPLTGVELGFEGLEFFTLPSLPTIRRLDALRANIKIGAIYVYSPDRAPQQDVAKRIGEGFAQFEPLMRRELALNGAMQNIPELPIDRDESGLPKVLVVKLQKPREDYIIKPGEEVRRGFPPGEADFNMIMQEIEPFVPPDWAYQILYYDLWKVVGDKMEASGNYGGGGGFSGGALLSALHLPFLKQSLFGNKEKHNNRWLYRETLEEEADIALQIFGHEFGHAAGLIDHVGVDYLTFDTAPFQSIMMGKISGSGCYNPLNQTLQCVFPPATAFVLARQPIINFFKYGWIEEDQFPPSATVISKEWTGNKVKVVLRLEDNGSGVHSVRLSSNLNPETHFWKLISHTENLNELVIEGQIPSRWALSPPGETKIYIGVVDYHGNTSHVQIF